MFCTKCGKQIPDNAAFCGYCGARTGVEKAPRVEEIKESKESKETNEVKAIKEEPAKMRKVPWVPLLIALAAVGAGFVLTWTVAERLAGWFLRPLLRVLPEGKTMIFTSYQAGFFFI